jgi:hypothetical protein
MSDLRGWLRPVRDVLMVDDFSDGDVLLCAVTHGLRQQDLCSA